MRTGSALLGMLLAVTCTTAHAQQLVKDIAPGTASGEPMALTDIGGTLYFGARDAAGGVDLYRSDGTAGGTTAITAFHVHPQAVLSQIVPVGGTIFFTVPGVCDPGAANTTAAVSGLYRSDGTTAGTVRIGDCRNATTLRDLLGELWFVQDQASVWKTDGTLPGTIEVATPPGTTGCGVHACIDFPGYPASFRQLGGAVYFVSSFSGLWKSDGTPEGTALAAGFSPGYFDDGFSVGDDFLAQLGDAFYFHASSAVGTELWRSDGTDGGTQPLVDINPGSDSSYPGQFRVVGSTVYFAADDSVYADYIELWKTNGTTDGTVEVRDINPGSPGKGSVPIPRAALGDVLLFYAEDGVHGRELWRTDGTGAGTQLVKDINPGPASSDAYYGYTVPKQAAVIGNIMYFAATDATAGIELWQTDGTEAGTTRVADINPGPADSSPKELTAVGNALFFAATTPAEGQELWVLGQPGGTSSASVDGVPALAVHRLAPPAGDESLSLRTVLHPGGTVDPTATGIDIAIRCVATDELLVHAAIPSGAYDGLTGWRARAGGRVRYVGDGSIAGIRHADVRPLADGSILLKVRGRHATYPVSAPDAPLALAVSLAPSEAGATAAFAWPACRATGSAVRCP